MIDLEQLADEIIAERKHKRARPTKPKRNSRVLTDRLGRKSVSRRPRKSRYANAKGKYRRWRCRCANPDCRARRTFKNHPERLDPAPRCHCGSKEWQVDWFRTTRVESRRQVCRCQEFPPDPAGNPHPHRKGSTRNYDGNVHACIHHRRPSDV